MTDRKCWDCGCDLEGEPGQVQCFNWDGHFVASLRRKLEEEPPTIAEATWTRSGTPSLPSNPTAPGRG